MPFLAPGQRAYPVFAVLPPEPRGGRSWAVATGFWIVSGVLRWSVDARRGPVGWSREANPVSLRLTLGFLPKPAHLVFVRRAVAEELHGNHKRSLTLGRGDWLRRAVRAVQLALHAEGRAFVGGLAGPEPAMP